MSRSHLHLPITDANGDVYPYASVAFNDPDSGAAAAQPIYVQPSGGNAVSMPLFCDPAVIDVWTDEPVRVQIVAIVAGNVRVQLEGIDIGPDPADVMQSPGPLVIAGADSVPSTSVLASTGRSSATFQVADPVGTHEHAGDSAGSVVLTGEDPADFDPYQTWVGYQAGENPASNSSASTALGPHAVLNGTSATILGVGEVTTQTSTGVLGDFATVVSSEDSNASQGGTAVGAANLLRQGTGMTVLGSVNGPGSPASVPNNAVGIGSGNDIGASGSVKIGSNHPGSTGGPNHVAVGTANSAQTNGLPWAGAQNPVVLGGTTTVAGDISTSLGSDDWFGGVSSLAIGKNSTAFNPSLVNLSGNVATNALFHAAGHATAGGQLTYSNGTQPMSFYGAGTPTGRQKVSYNASDVPHTALSSLLSALAATGLITTPGTNVVSESGAHPDGTALEFAESGQALQWKCPAGSTDAVAANPFTVASNRITLAPGALNGYATGRNRGFPALFSGSMLDVTCAAQFAFNATGTNLITNPDFETNTTGWSTYDGDTIARDTMVARYNTSSLKITPSGTVGGARASYGFNGVTAGTTYTFSAWVYPTTTRSVHIAMDGYTSSFAFTGAFAATDQSLPPNTWSRISVTGTVPSGGTVNTSMNVGYLSATNPTPTEYLWVDGAMLTAGSTLLPFVDSTGYSPDDYFTGLMVKSYLAYSGGHAIPTGYLMGRKSIYSMSGKSIIGTLTNLTAVPGSGDVLGAKVNGTSIVFTVNGGTVASITDSLYASRVKCGFRVTESTGAYNFTAAPS